MTINFGGFLAIWAFGFLCGFGFLASMFMMTPGFSWLRAWRERG